MRIVFNRRRRLRDQDSKSETHAMTAVNGAFDTVVDAETLEESPPAAEELGLSGITTGTEHYCLRVNSCIYTIDRSFSLSRNKNKLETVQWKKPRK